MTKDRFYCLRQLACNAQNDLELEAKDALAEIEGAHHDITRLMDACNAEVNEAQRLRESLTMLIREAQNVADDHHRPRYARLDEALESAREALAGSVHEPAAPPPL